MLNYGPELAQASQSSANAAGAGFRAVGDTISGIGSQAMQIGGQIRRADEAGKIAKYKSDLDSKVNEFNMGLMTRQDFGNWTGELDALLSDESGLPEDLSNEARFGLKIQMDEFRAKAHDKTAMVAMTRTVEESKANVMYASQQAAERGNYDLSVSILENEGAGIFPESVIRKAVDGIREQEQAINFSLDDDADPSRVSDIETIAKDKDKYYEINPNSNENARLKAIDNAQRIRERQTSEGISEINERDRSEEFRTVEEYREALESDPRIPNDKREIMLRNFQKTTPLDSKTYLDSMRVVEDMTASYLRGDMTAEEYDRVWVDAHTQAMGIGSRRQGSSDIVNAIKNVRREDLDRIKASREGTTKEPLEDKLYQTSLRVGLAADISNQDKLTAKAYEENEEEAPLLTNEQASAQAIAKNQAKDVATQAGLAFRKANPTKSDAEVLAYTKHVYWKGVKAGIGRWSPLSANKGIPQPKAPIGLQSKANPVYTMPEETITAEPKPSNVFVEPELPEFEADEPPAAFGNDFQDSLLPPKGETKDYSAPDAFGPVATETTPGVIPQGIVDTGGKLQKLDESPVYRLHEGQWIKASGLMDADDSSSDFDTNNNDAIAPKASASRQSGVTLDFSAPVEKNLLDFIKGYEGYTSVSKWDVKQHSIGYGTKSFEGEKITKAEAEKRLSQEVSKHQAYVVKEAERRGYDLTPQQLIAMTSFGFNAGDGRVAAAFGAGPTPQDWAQYMKYIRNVGTKYQKGLERRRQSEAALMGVLITY